MKLRNFLRIGIITLVLFSCSNDNDTAQNRAPVAAAGDNRQVEIGSTVLLDASASTDADGDVLTYQWTFTEKPEASEATITDALSAQAEFTLDRAGTYIVTLMVNDGELSTSSTVNVTNKAPELDEIYLSNPLSGLDKNYAYRGREIDVGGLFFSEIAEENKVTLGGVACDEVFVKTNMDGSLYLEVIVPEEAVGGDLVVTVGPHSVTWPEPVQIVTLPVHDFIAQHPDLEKRLRSRPAGSDDKWKEIGVKFRPSKQGSIVAFYNSAKDILGELRVTLWDAATGLEITQAEFEPVGNGSYYELDTPIPLELGKEYILSTFSDRWNNYIHAVPETIYPETLQNMEIMEGRASIGFSSGQSESHYPDNEIFNTYVPLGADMAFVEDLE